MFRAGLLPAALLATQLHDLLQRAAVPGPYVLVGHSNGGYLVRAFHKRFASEVAGAVLVDSSSEYMDERFQSTLGKDWKVEAADNLRSAHRMRPVVRALQWAGVVRWQLMQAAQKQNFGLPPAVVGDPNRLSQVLFNLVGNAVKFTERGSVTLAVRHRRVEGGAVELQFEVRDTGIGIPPEAQAKVFEPFFQVDNTSTRAYGGTGLGLAIVRSFVEAHGGAVGLESKPGAGSTFYVTLPTGG